MPTPENSSNYQEASLLEKYCFDKLESTQPFFGQFGPILEVKPHDKVEIEEKIELNEDEERLLAAYRQFVAKNTANSVFKWRIPEPEGITLPAEINFVLDPREVA